MSLIEFPYTLHKGFLMPIIPITIHAHRTWVFVDSGATFTILSVDDAVSNNEIRAKNNNNCIPCILTLIEVFILTAIFFLEIFTGIV